MSGRILCVGDVMIDVNAALPTPLAIGSDTPAPIRLLGGGSAANTACWLVAAGTAAGFIGRVGDDALGRLAASELRAAGVDAQLGLDADRPTGSCIVLVDVDGERTMIPDSGANRALAPADMDPLLFQPGDHLHLSAYTLFHAGQAGARRALELARSATMTISVDASSAAPLAAFGVEEFFDLIGPDVLLFANLDEARVLTGEVEASVCADVLRQRVAAVVIKLGADGALYAAADQSLPVAAHPIEVLDSTGAGDAFAAGLLAAGLSGATPEQFVRAGNELAARACQVAGGRPPAGG